MTQYNTLNVKLSNSELNKFKSGIRNGIEVTLKISWNVVGDSNDENNFPHKLFLTDTQVSRLRKALANGSSANIKLSKTQLHKIRQSGGFIGRILGPLLKPVLPLIGNVLKPLAKIVLTYLGLTAASVTDAAIHKKKFQSGMRPSNLASRTALIISNEERNYIMKIIKSLEESGLLIKSLSKTIKNKPKEQKGEFLSMLLGKLGASLLGNLLLVKGAIATRQGRGIIRARESTIRAEKGTIRAAQDF